MKKPKPSITSRRSVWCGQTDDKLGGRRNSRVNEDDRRMLWLIGGGGSLGIEVWKEWLENEIREGSRRVAPPPLHPELTSSVSLFCLFSSLSLLYVLSRHNVNS
ncbi:hypothetical protein CRG98_018387 [Punica granatum]|uniref:Uncharacterized protein n=1 Tax=Punica granatum TaxID=22663 RepID=A0A2I0JY31_PUNGR|nr:hypothetical protein CRG98_018387 [Punica granatum]